jgi:hypothetical protein
VNGAGRAAVVHDDRLAAARGEGGDGEQRGSERAQVSGRRADGGQRSHSGL